MSIGTKLRTSRSLPAALAFGALLVLSACTGVNYDTCSPFHCLVDVEDMGGGIYKVSAQGNVENSVRELEEFALLKSAEFTLEQSKTHFQIVNSMREDGYYVYYGSQYPTGSKIILSIKIASAADLAAGEIDKEQWIPAQTVYDRFAPLHIDNPEVSS